MDDKKLPALVTGASRGIGKAIALRLAQDGWQVIGTATRPQGAGHIDEYFAAAGFSDCTGKVLDLQNTNTLLAQNLDAIWEIATPLAIVNNAGITRDALVMRQSPAEFQEVLQVNLAGAFQVTRKALRGMIKARWGRIVGIGSVSAAMGNAGQAAYAASKGGMAAMNRSLAKEIAARGITVNTVEPGFIETDMTADFSDEVRQAFETAIPMGRFGQPEEIAALVSFLLSKEAGYLSGQTLRMDGGLYMS